MNFHNHYLRLLGLLFAALLMAGSAAARPGWSQPLDVPQPDGTTITLLMHGDEFFNFITTADGYTVVKDADGYYHYAQRDTDGTLTPTAIIARNAAERNAADLAFLNTMKKRALPDMTESQRQLKADAARLYGTSPWMPAMTATAASADAQTATPGGPRKLFGGRIDYSQFHGLIILVEFNDRKFLREDANSFYKTLTSEADLKGFYDANGENYTEIDGSVRDYFFQNSMGQFSPTFDVVGPVQIDYKATDAKKDQNTYPLLRAALQAANSQVDYSQYDLNDDGYVDMVYFIFAGYGSYVQGNNADYLWPHASDLSGYSLYYGLRFDGMRFGRYACSLEIQDQEALADKHQYLDGIGTMCHEFSHVLGLADHYDVNYEEQGQSDHPAMWDVMAGGADYNRGYTPVGYNAYERYTLGFAPLQTLDMEGEYTLESFNTSNQFYRIPTGTRNEYFYIENRQREKWDRFLPGHGLLVWRVDSTNKSVWERNGVNNNPDHMYYELLKAVPGKSYSTNYIPFPGAGSVMDLTANTTPALRSWADDEAVMDLFDITETDGVISFNAGKNLYEQVAEDFETMDLTTGDAAGVAGRFADWDLNNAQIASVDAEGKGNDSHVVKLLRSGTIVMSATDKPIRNVVFKAWAGSQQVRLSLRENSSGSWKVVKTTDGQSQVTMKKDTEDFFIYNTSLPAGTQLQVMMSATSADAVAYIDDLEITYANDAQGIDAFTADSDRSKASYNLSGQRVADSYRGLVITNGRKVIR